MGQPLNEREQKILAELEAKRAGMPTQAETGKEMKYRVLVDDNFHYMDEDERYELGSFQTAEAAVEAARRVVDEFLISNQRPGMTAQQLLAHFVSFGEDAFIVAEGADRVNFSAREYAKQRCQELCIPENI